VPTGIIAFPKQKVSLESGATGFSQQLSLNNQAGFITFHLEKPRLGETLSHEEIEQFQKTFQH
jgi:hypothetical protein